MQVCGILVSRRVDENPENVFNTSSRINSTWGGNLTDMVRSSKILEIIEEDDLCINAAVIGSYLQSQLKEIAYESDVISNIRGKGLLTAFDFQTGDMRDNFLRLGLENNTMFLGCGDKSIRFRPALIMDNGHVDEGFTTFRNILQHL